MLDIALPLPKHSTLSSEEECPRFMAEEAHVSVQGAASQTTCNRKVNGAATQLAAYVDSAHRHFPRHLTCSRMPSKQTRYSICLGAAHKLPNSCLLQVAMAACHFSKQAPKCKAAEKESTILSSFLLSCTSENLHAQADVPNCEKVEQTGF